MDQDPRQPRLSEAEVALRGRRRDPEHRRRFLHRQAPEGATFERPTAAGADSLEAGEGLVDHQNVVRSPGRIGQQVCSEFHARSPPRPFAGGPPVCPVHKDAAHQAACGSEEMRAIPPFDPIDLHELQVGLVDEGHGVERVIRPFAPYSCASQRTEPIVHERDEPIERLAVPVL
jgi:hypothetical protein